MTFEELWEKVEQLKIIPDAGIKQIPAVLSVRTKRNSAIVLQKKRHQSL